ncbi:AMP-dependent synthetase and ligase family protein [Actinidia rufa]|uniref:AMP-dependent synthetase and ligase family protein n=1 Tax=Actinidia rufa TaxID=165716 RepID=A0A7J0EQD6_9ERIC|nr:AMP-dependent synthetase and ligase family protein [Actinidia rufa]
MDLLKPSAPNSTPLTPITFLERAATVYGDCPSLIPTATNTAADYTWSETHRRCLKMASAIASLGVDRGDVVSVVAPNTPAMYELHFAVPMAGAVINTVNTRLDSNTVSVLLRHGESKLVFVDYQYLALLLNALSIFPPNLKPPKLVLITDDAPAAEIQSYTVGFNYPTYEELVESGDPGFNWVRPKSEWDPMTLNYTSGTTSSPKGVVHCHRSIFIMALDSLIDWFVPKQPVYLWTLPMFHSNGWCFTWAMAAVGGTNVCLRKVDPPTVYTAIRKNQVTHMCGAPVILNMLSNFPISEPLKNPVQFLTGGAPPPAAVLLRTESLGFVVSHGYGLTEVAGVVVSCAWKRQWNSFPATERARLKARQGVRTIGLTQIDVVDPVSGTRVKRDGSTMGEIVLRGPSLMLGYLKNQEATSSCMRNNGWMYTGDVGVMHTDGYLEIKDRSKDIIITGGENVSSVEVESVLYSHPAVNEAAVVARPDEFWGETPCAFVSLKTSPPAGNKRSENDVIEFCRARLPHYMVPRTVVFREELPKTSTGKIQKAVLRENAKTMGSLQASRL